MEATLTPPSFSSRARSTGRRGFNAAADALGADVAVDADPADAVGAAVAADGAPADAVAVVAVALAVAAWRLSLPLRPWRW